MEFYHRNNKIAMNKEHYDPSFITHDVFALRDDKEALGILQSFGIFGEVP